MAILIVDPPHVRQAGSLNLKTEDAAALRSFRSFAGAGIWYEREAEKVLRRAIRLFVADELRQRDRLLLIEREDDRLGVAIFGEESAATAHLGFVGLRVGAHGARIDSETGPRLSDATVESCLEEATLLGFERMTAQVAREHKRSQCMLHRAGFAFVSRFDHDYDLWAIRLG